MTYEVIKSMTTEAINNRIHELDIILMGDCTSNDWTAYTEYNDCIAVLDERHREESQAALDAFYTKHIKGKSWNEIDPKDWGFYSDWHKDIYGFRPCTI